MYGCDIFPAVKPFSTASIKDGKAPQKTMSIASWNSNSVNDDSSETSRSSSLTHLESRAHYVAQSFTSFISQDTLFEMTKNFEREIDEAASGSSVSMLPTQCAKPSRDIEGTRLVIDLGGSTLRCAIAKLDRFTPQSSQSLFECKWNIKDSEKRLDLAFFQLLAQRVSKSLSENGLIHRDEPFPTGISWSFPLDQVNHNDGFINKVSKGYAISDEVRGKSLKFLVESAFAKEGFPVRVDAIINDAVAVYIAGLYFYNCSFAVVLGTGANFSLSVERDTLCERRKQSHRGGQRKSHKEIHKEVIINSEMSFFGSHLKPFVNHFDHLLDDRWILLNNKNQPHMSNSLNVFQPLELLCSGRYISELVRLAMLELFVDGLLFPDHKKCSFLALQYGVSGEFVCKISDMELFNVEEFSAIISKEFPKGKFNLTEPDFFLLKTTVDAVITRAAAVLACSIAAMTNWLKSSGSVTVGYVGSVLEHFHGYRNQVESFLRELEECRVLHSSVALKHVENSSILGAGIATG